MNEITFIVLTMNLVFIIIFPMLLSRIVTGKWFSLVFGISAGAIAVPIILIQLPYWILQFVTGSFSMAISVGA